MKLNISKEQCLRLAKLEGDSEVGAGFSSVDCQPGTILDFKRLSWDGTKYRGEQVLAARERVHTRKEGVVLHCGQPHEIPTLLQQMGVMKHGSDWKLWLAFLTKEVAEYAEMRRGAKVARSIDLTLSIAKGAA